ncbi:MAG: hypothetical protein IPO21_08695 [Bacteroidales bacterium]|nr:hypothetical protein [Bacteroidales bacterium]
MNKGDINIIEEIKKGNPLVFKEVYRLYYAQLCRFASDYIEDADEVEDLVQDTLIKIWDKREELAITNLKNYLFTSVRNACINRLEHIKIVQNHKEKNISEIKILELKDETSDNDFIVIIILLMKQLYVFFYL